MILARYIFVYSFSHFYIIKFLKPNIFDNLRYLFKLRCNTFEVITLLKIILANLFIRFSAYTNFIAFKVHLNMLHWIVCISKFISKYFPSI